MSDCWSIVKAKKTQTSNKIVDNRKALICWFLDDKPISPKLTEELGYKVLMAAK